MKLTKQHQLALFGFIFTTILFAAIFLWQGNYEFTGHIVIIYLLLIVLMFSTKTVDYPNYIGWGLLFWTFLHLLGGVVMTNGELIYKLMLFSIVGEPYNILKYDQAVHFLGFFVATLVMYFVLKKYLKPDLKWLAVGLVVAMAGMGLGALNEVVEFFITIILPNANVGGYENTALDLVSNLFGAITAITFLKLKAKPAEKINSLG